jgi:hypothetical protein
MPNRIAIYLTAIAGLLTALAPVVADLDTSSTVGILGGLAAVTVVAREFLVGWRQYEERTDLEALTVDQLGDMARKPDLPE